MLKRIAIMPSGEGLYFNFNKSTYESQALDRIYELMSNHFTIDYLKKYFDYLLDAIVKQGEPNEENKRRNPNSNVCNYKAPTVTRL